MVVLLAVPPWKMNKLPVRFTFTLSIIPPEEMNIRESRINTLEEMKAEPSICEKYLSSSKEKPPRAPPVFRAKSVTDPESLMHKLPPDSTITLLATESVADDHRSTAVDNGILYCPSLGKIHRTIDNCIIH